jgi:hypothetical protein
MINKYSIHTQYVSNKFFIFKFFQNKIVVMKVKNSGDESKK